MTKRIVPFKALNEALIILEDILAETPIYKDPNQLSLIPDDTDQAFDAFMDEREELKRLVRDLGWSNQSLKDTLNEVTKGYQQVQGQLQHSRSAQLKIEDVLIRAAEYNQQLQAGLNGVGITFTPGDYGQPVINIDPERIQSFIFALEI